jgi:hypothetical protein
MIKKRAARVECAGPGKILFRGRSSAPLCGVCLCVCQCHGGVLGSRSLVMRPRSRWGRGEGQSLTSL